MSKYKRVRRRVLVPCKSCMGSGIGPSSNGQKKCPECKGTGNVETWIVEVVLDDDDEN